MSISEAKWNFSPFVLASVCDLRAPHRLTRPAFEAHLGAITFPPEGSVNALISAVPSASRNTFSVSTITDGNARIGERSTLPALTLAWLYIEQSPCGGMRPADDPVHSDPGAVFEDDPHPWSDAGRPLEPWVCHHTQGADGRVQSELPPTSPECWPFSPALAYYPGATPYCHRNTAGCWAEIGGACRFPVPRGDNLPFLGSPVLPPLRLTGGIATPTKRYHGRMLSHPSPPACATPEVTGARTHAGSGPSRVRRRLLSTRLGDSIPLAIDHLWFTSHFCQVPRRNLFQLLPFFNHCCFCCGNLHGLRHRNKFVYQIATLQWIVTLSCNMVLMTIRKRFFHTQSCVFTGFQDTCKFWFEIISLTTGSPHAYSSCLSCKA